MSSVTITVDQPRSRIVIERTSVDDHLYGVRVDGDVESLLADAIRAIRAALGLDTTTTAQAWDQGWHAHFLEWEHQRRDPTHPIARVNPYGDGEAAR